VLNWGDMSIREFLQ